MQDIMLISVQYGGYISIVKFVIFLILFFLWLPLVSWVYRDAQEVGAKENVWGGIVGGASALAILIWLILPIFIVGMIFYMAVIATTAIIYVKHRNTRVMEFDRIMTVEHIKSLFSPSEQKKLSGEKNFVFITANGNEVPVPEARTPEFYGYKAAFDILSDASWRRAENLAFVPTAQDYGAAYQIDGAVVKQPSVEKEQAKYFINFLKSLADLDPKEKRKPQKGKFKIRKEKNTIEWEVTTAGSTVGEQIQIKRGGMQDVKKLSDIGLMPEQYAQLNSISELKKGLFIVTGPPKSGLSTTFYAMLRNHDAFLNSINTLERQPSAKLPNITQNVFSLSDTGTTTYARKLHTIIRMGPDIVGIAEGSDPEVAKIAREAAKDGKLIYIQFEADSVLQAFAKWMKLIGDKNLAMETLIGISNQRLLRTLCDECKQGYAPDKELLRKFNIPSEKAKVLYRAGKVIYDKHGKPLTCENCQGTGFVGRIGIFEIITINDELKNAILPLNSISEIGSQFRRAKMLSLQEQAMKHVIEGRTAINEMVMAFSSGKKPQSPEAGE
ncbi:MAG: ATPase, T2SS/T4P/T4SS family [Planctomycetota bacterium]|nr:ATPase, T2SS/T4P/T4SS family [Planctomycetota bacterium]